jgi:hypothetical protein
VVGEFVYIRAFLLASVESFYLNFRGIVLRDFQDFFLMFEISRPNEEPLVIDTFFRDFLNLVL